MENKFQQFEDFFREKLSTDEELAAEFLRVCAKDYSENGDKEELLSSLKLLAEAKGLSKLARQTGLSRNVFYQSLAPQGNPRLDTLLVILKCLNLKLEIKPISAKKV